MNSPWGRKTILALGAGTNLFAACSSASGQWTAISMHPQGVDRSYVAAVSPTLQGGQAQVAGAGGTTAALWSGSAQTMVTMGASPTQGGAIFGIDGDTQVGWLSSGGGHASLWHGTPQSRVDLHPALADVSQALAIAGSQQAGVAVIGGIAHAGYWRGTAASWVDLNPSGAVYSTAYGTDGVFQGGVVRFSGSSNHAALWNGSTASFVDLQPPTSIGGTSSIYGMATGQQVGQSSVPGSPSSHASIWSGTAASWLDVTPFPGFFAELRATTGSVQVGRTNVPGFSQEHAGVWFGSAASFFDLHSVLPPGYGSSAAFAVTDLPGGGIMVGGYATNSLGVDEAYLWVRVPAPGSAALLAFGGLVVNRRRR